jgi:D-tagatose-bisphosphate aldolase class II non-catalytic subunit
VIDALTTLAASRREGTAKGMPSVCSAHPLVVKAAAREAADAGAPLLIEATCNQVNQFGGYTGMQPADFVSGTMDIARRENLPAGRLIFGGDHLGPNPWRDEPAESAMRKAEDMVDAYARAGFRKLHLDASMGCGSEAEPLGDATIAERAARLAARAERTAAALGGAMPVYVIGTEVPPPGGAHHAISEIEPTSLEEARNTLEVHREVFRRHGLDGALSRVIAIVVQPGVEFGNENVILYDRARAARLPALLAEEPNLVYEAHSTDYQGPRPLRALVEDGFAILKVGPELTYRLREALYGLDLIASDLFPDYGPRALYAAMEQAMLADESHWRSHYRGTPAHQRLGRHYSFSDRIRYYWGQPGPTAAVERLVATLTGRTVPITLFRQHLPTFETFAGKPLEPSELVISAVRRGLEDYRYAASGAANRS